MAGNKACCEEDAVRPVAITDVIPVTFDEPVTELHAQCDVHANGICKSRTVSLNYSQRIKQPVTDPHSVSVINGKCVADEISDNLRIAECLAVCIPFQLAESGT